MKINKDLVDAVMMLSAISMVLVGTSDFSDQGLKTILMVGLGVLTVAMVGLRVMASKALKKEED